MRQVQSGVFDNNHQLVLGRRLFCIMLSIDLAVFSNFAIDTRFI